MLLDPKGPVSHTKAYCRLSALSIFRRYISPAIHEIGTNFEKFYANVTPSIGKAMSSRVEFRKNATDYSSANKK